MKNMLAVILGKLIHYTSSSLRLGAGGTWPGEMALMLHPHILSTLSSQLKEGVIIVAGTNGKTTTTLMIKQILEKQGYLIVHNATGANLLNGVTSAFIQKVNWLGAVQADWGLFEVDENSLPIVLRELNYSSSDPPAGSDSIGAGGESRSYIKESSRLRSNNKKLLIVLLNLFRDQLDRYGEVDVIAEKWDSAMQNLPTNTTVVANADDPLIAHLGITHAVILNASEGSRPKVVRASLDSSSASRRTQNDRRVIYFGLNNKKHFLKQKEHATDSIFCLNCGGRLEYSGIYFSHIGIWKCTKCGEKRPEPDVSKWDSPLPGLYNLYNTLAAVSIAQSLNISETTIKQSLKDFSPAFGRQEEFEVDHKKIKIFLSKNPAGFNASIRTVLELNPKVMLLVLNDRIPDGRDVSWIWDVDFEKIAERHGTRRETTRIIVSGERVYDLALRIKYSFQQWNNKTMKSREAGSGFARQSVIIRDLASAIEEGLRSIKKEETLYILPTYSAMLEVRKILTGRKIL